MELEKKYVNLCRMKGRAVSQVTLEADLNVPDQKPDIFRMVHSQGEFRPDEIKGEDGKVKVRGIFLYRILYIGEGNDRMPELLEGSVPVDETIFFNELEEGDGMDVRWELENLRVSVIHSRKANMKCILALAADAFREQPVPMIECPTDAQELYLRMCPVQLQQEVVHKKDTLRVREDVSLPPGRPNIHRILWKEMHLQGAEARPEEGKIQVKGELVLFVLYESEEEGRRLQWLEQSIPFRSEVDCPTCHHDLFGKAEITIQRAEMELQADYDGEPRTVRVDVILELLMRYFDEGTEEILCDAYSLSKAVTPLKKTCLWNHVQQISDSRTRVSGRMKLSDGVPKILQILSSGIYPHLEHAERTEQGLLLQGNVELWVLYAASDDAQPVACAVQSFPFEHTAETADLDEKTNWQVFLCLDQLMVNMLDAQELEMKAVLQIQAVLQKPEELEVIEDLQEAPLDKERIKKMPGMVIHVVQPGETLWDIAKAHMTTCKAVMEVNELKEENVKVGQKVLLVKEVGR